METAASAPRLEHRGGVFGEAPCWYSGSGIYRNVRLVTTEDVYVAYNGVCITTPRVTDEEAIVAVRTEVVAPPSKKYQVRNKVVDAVGKLVAWSDNEEPIVVPHPHRWDITDPYLYTLETEVLVDGRVKDCVETRFGIRTIRWDKDEGFILNGRKVMLQGVCLHHDMGCIGTAVHRRAIERQLTLMKEMGVNAIRTTHNPPATEVLELCDEMGLLVMDEAFDTWRHNKAKYDYANYFDEWHERDLRDFVKRDRNHPSVILWSIGNEIYEQSGKEGKEREANRALTTHLATVVREMDATRAVTSGTHAVSRNNCIVESGALDVIGLNYHDYGYDSLRFVTIEAIDEQGLPVPTADLMLEFSVDGQGELFGVDNGNAAETLCLKGNKMPLFSGKALAVVRSLQGKRGTALLQVKSAVGEKTMTIRVE